MDPNTGHLVQLKPGEEAPAGYEALPDRLAEAAQAEVDKAGGSAVHIPLDGEGPLPQYRRDLLQQKRKQRTRRRRNSKLARRARRKN